MRTLRLECIMDRDGFKFAKLYSPEEKKPIERSMWTLKEKGILYEHVHIVRGVEVRHTGIDRKLEYLLASPRMSVTCTGYV